MNNEIQKTYWTSAAEREGRAAAEREEHAAGPAALSRRRFLEAAGFSVSLATLGGCSRIPVEYALPLPVQPAGVTPGRMLSYASTCAGCPAACGMLVGVRDGRPLKMEGMPEHPLSRGGLCAIGQALPMELYDRQRWRQPRRDGEPTTWQVVDQAIAEQLASIATAGGAVRLVTPSVTSPTLQASIDEFLKRFGDARHIQFDPLSCSAILAAHELTHGRRRLPHYRLDRAAVLVSFGADFLGTWISPVEFTAAWRTRRTPTADHPEMSHHVHFEGRVSLTGGNADRRWRLAPDRYGIVLSHLATRLADLAGATRPPGELADAPLPAAHELAELSKRLWAARGESLVLCDSQEVEVQLLVNFINQTLGNYGKTVDMDRASRQRQGDDGQVLRLVEELEAGKVAALLVAGGDLTHNLPSRETLAAGIRETPLVVSFSDRDDDFTSLADFVCPDHHPLESWLDAEPIRGLFSLRQPTLRPLGQSRSILESLARWSGGEQSAYDLVRATWRKQVLPRLPQQPFQEFWDRALHDGFVDTGGEAEGAAPFRANDVKLAAAPLPAEELTLSLYSKVGLTDSRHAHNPWLQELPDPITKATWDNYVCLSPALADEYGLEDGDLVRLEAAAEIHLELPAFVQAGQHDRVLAVALAYGVRGTERFADIGPQWIEARPTLAAGERVGKNAASLIDVRSGGLQYDRGGVTLTKIGGRRDLATTQRYHSLKVPADVAPHGAEVRHQIQETTLSAFVKDHGAGAPPEHHHADRQLWAEDHPKTGRWWGMAVDLNACTGCSACLIACQSENNVAVVGKDEVRRQREMHWIRIDRYYSGDDDDLEVSFQPMMCQHCDNAPCETVCPVLATIHGEEGLNEQAYNRCVGTRYCANNCPYKVRRFNWFKYEHPDSLQNLAFNPDVTVRTRGVMEKCSLCVQRIEEVKIAAKALGQPVADGDIRTACQQSCPGQAIVFGDMNDANSQIRTALEDPRRYRVLEEFNFRPSVAYLRVVRNRDEEAAESDHV